MNYDISSFRLSVTYMTFFDRDNCCSLVVDVDMLLDVHLVIVFKLFTLKVNWTNWMDE